MQEAENVEGSLAFLESERLREPLFRLALVNRIDPPQVFPRKALAVACSVGIAFLHWTDHPVDVGRCEVAQPDVPKLEGTANVESVQWNNNGDGLYVLAQCFQEFLGPRAYRGNPGSLDPSGEVLCDVLDSAHTPQFRSRRDSSCDLPQPRNRLAGQYLVDTLSVNLDAL